ncbi:MAG: hypothetical protein D8M56_23145 [Chloroflexi bacterium]|nr:hypothetical protein [Chloroflexota bacterium]
MLQWVYRDQPLPQEPINNSTPQESSRNQLVENLYQSGVSVPALAKQFGISKARVYQILKDRRK